MNKTKKQKTMAAVIGAAVVVSAAVSLSSCKGRTADNMEPTGETVEVILDETIAPVDTIAENPK